MMDANEKRFWEEKFNEMKLDSDRLVTWAQKYGELSAKTTNSLETVKGEIYALKKKIGRLRQYKEPFYENWKFWISATLVILVSGILFFKGGCVTVKDWGNLCTGKDSEFFSNATSTIK